MELAKDFVNCWRVYGCLIAPKWHEKKVMLKESDQFTQNTLLSNSVKHVLLRVRDRCCRGFRGPTVSILSQFLLIPNYGFINHILSAIIFSGGCPLKSCFFHFSDPTGSLLIEIFSKIYFMCQYLSSVVVSNRPSGDILFALESYHTDEKNDLSKRLWILVYFGFRLDIRNNGFFAM